MSKDDDTKRLEILKLIINKHSEPTVTSLMKIVYLADLLTLKELGSRLTNYKYERYYYGPFDSQIYKDIDNLVKEGVVVPKQRFSGEGDGGEYFVFEPTDTLDLNTESSNLIDKKEREILENLLEDVKGYGAKALTQAAYQTKPMKKINATLGGNEHLHDTLDLNA